jgi:hypothetical protein
LNESSTRVNLSSKGLQALTLETGAGIATQSECRFYQGYWNMALVCDAGGVNTFQCIVDRELTILGVTVKGNYAKGTTYYNVVWERWTCISSAGNCCIASSQGVRVISVG